MPKSATPRSKLQIASDKESVRTSESSPRAAACAAKATKRAVSTAASQAPVAQQQAAVANTKIPAKRASKPISARKKAGSPAARNSSESNSKSAASACQDKLTSEVGKHHVNSVAPIKPLLSLGVENGIFVVVILPEGAMEVCTLELTGTKSVDASWQKSTYLKYLHAQKQIIICTAFVPLSGPPAGNLHARFEFKDGQSQTLELTSVAYTRLSTSALLEVLKRLGRTLKPAFDSILPERHPLRCAYRPTNHERVFGNFEGVIEGKAYGWAWMPDKPHDRLEIEVIYNGEVMGRGTADLYRSDLKTHGIGDGHHHFRIPLSYELFDGHEHNIRLRLVCSGTEIPGSPYRVSFPTSRPLLRNTIPRLLATSEFNKLLARAQSSEKTSESTEFLDKFRFACLLQETDQPAQARGLFEGFIETLGSNALCQCKIGETLLLEDEPMQALQAYERAAQAEPGYVWAHLGMGTALRLLKRFSDASASYEAALEADPDNQAAVFWLRKIDTAQRIDEARQTASRGDTGAAQAQLMALLLQQPDNEEVCKELDTLLMTISNVKSQVFLRNAAVRAARSHRLLNAVLDATEADSTIEILKVGNKV